MQIAQVADAAATLDVEVLAIGIHADGLSAAARDIDDASGGTIQRLIDLGEFKPESGKSLTLYCLPNVTTPVVLLVGLGTRKESTRGIVFRAAALALRTMTDRRRGKIGLVVDPEWSADWQAEWIAGALVGAEDVALYKTDAKRGAPDQLLLIGAQTPALSQGRAIGSAINFTRRLVNEPASVIYPESFVSQVQDVFQSVDGVELEVWDESRLRKERCGALLAVAQGSDRPPRMLMMRYANADPQAECTALVGKGVTFDSGGLSLKPSSSMLTMKADMAGAATVVGAILAVANLRLPVNVLGIVGLVENMPSAKAYKLGDVLTARNGRTIEVHNTDAEGRLVLADALSVAVDSGVHRVVDYATLTGSCVVALGNQVAGAMTNHQAWCDQVLAAAQRVDEAIWQLPMFPEYGEMIKSAVADIKNVGEGRYGGAMTAAKLLEHFVDGKPWVHLDIAGPAFSDKAKPWLDAGATGIMVRTTVELMRSMSWNESL